jgi:hypothetical protein
VAGLSDLHAVEGTAIFEIRQRGISKAMAIGLFAGAEPLPGASGVHRGRYDGRGWIPRSQCGRRVRREGWPRRDRRLLPPPRTWRRCMAGSRRSPEPKTRNFPFAGSVRLVLSCAR